MQRTIRENLTPTLEQRRSLAAYLEAQRNAIHAAEREQTIAAWGRPEPVNFCADDEEYSDSPLPTMIVWALISIACWALFGWGVVAIVRSFQ